MTTKRYGVCRWFLPVLLILTIPAQAQAQPPAVPAKEAPFPVQIDRAKDEFCLIMVPDTQRYTAFFPDIMRAQFTWIRDAVGPLNVKYVVHVGDVTEDNSPQEWILADEMFGLLDGVVPYTVVPGNHDIDDQRKASERFHSTSSFNAVFSPKRFAGRPWWGGNQAPRSDNSFGYFKAGGTQFLVLGLEYGPTDETLAWANSVTDNHADQHKVIVVTHCYMDQDDTRLGEGDNYTPHKMNKTWNDGDQMWDKFVKRNGNIVMVLCGHVKGDGTGLLVSKGDKGNPVVQMLANYQFMEHGGQGWLRILKFRPGEKKLDVFTYSPWLKKFREETDQRFTLDVPQFFR